MKLVCRNSFISGLSIFGHIFDASYRQASEQEREEEEEDGQAGGDEDGNGHERQEEENGAANHDGNEDDDEDGGEAEQDITSDRATSELMVRFVLMFG